ncbi:MAG: helix-turn-helix domain-containing protein [Oligoflexia bacterium]|nr:helix-turn-helix domain-containing protein [Oligoflexia bacterium]
MNKDNTTKSHQQDQRLITAKVSLLQLAEELGNIQKACKAAGIARSSFYEIKRADEKFGREGLVSHRKGKKIHRLG